MTCRLDLTGTVPWVQDIQEGSGVQITFKFFMAARTMSPTLNIPVMPFHQPLQNILCVVCGVCVCVCARAQRIHHACTMHKKTLLKVWLLAQSLMISTDSCISHWNFSWYYCFYVIWIQHLTSYWLNLITAVTLMSVSSPQCTYRN